MDGIWRLRDRWDRGRWVVGVRMEQLRRFFNLRITLISETLPPCRQAVGAIMHTMAPDYFLRIYTNMDIRNHGQTRGALMLV